MQLKLTAFLSAVIFNIGMMFSGGIIGQAKAGESTLIFGHSADTDILDPHATGGWITYEVTYQMFEGFVKEDLSDPNAKTPKLIPALATSWDTHFVSERGSNSTMEQHLMLMPLCIILTGFGTKNLLDSMRRRRDL